VRIVCGSQRDALSEAVVSSRTLDLCDMVDFDIFVEVPFRGWDSQRKVS